MSLIVEIKDDASLTSNSVYGLVYIIGLTPTRAVKGGAHPVRYNISFELEWSKLMECNQQC